MAIVFIENAYRYETLTKRDNSISSFFLIFPAILNCKNGYNKNVSFPLIESDALQWLQKF